MWKKSLLVLVVLLLVVSPAFSSSKLGWLFWEPNEETPVVSQESQEENLEMPSAEMDMTEPSQPSESSNEELLKEVETGIEMMRLGEQIHATGDEELISSYQEVLAATPVKDPLKWFVLPEVRYTPIVNTWGAGLSGGIIGDTFIVSLGVDMGIKDWNSFTDLSNYTVSIGAGYVF